MTTFDLEKELPRGRIVIEASAGTGKTFTLSALLARHLIERDDLESKHVLMMTFTNAAAADLRSRTREMLINARSTLKLGSAPLGYEWMSIRWLDPSQAHLLEARLSRATRAINRFEEMTISTIHGFCQQALRQLGLRSGAPIGLEVVGSAPDIAEAICRDVFLDAALTGSMPTSDGQSFDYFFKTAWSVLKVMADNPNCRLIPDKLSNVKDPMGTDGDHFYVKDDNKRESLEAVHKLIEQSLQRVRRTQSTTDVVSYDTLIRLMVEVIVRAESLGQDDALTMLRDRFRLGMVDEFQDTDRQQWRIVDGIFPAGGESDLVLVGDPKQAIYRFRGADVNTYLDAKAMILSDPPSPRQVSLDQFRIFELSTNFRSDPRLIDATNAFLSKFLLGDERIEVLPVGADPRKPRALGLGSAPSLRVRLLDDPNSRGAGLAAKRAAILRDLVAQVSRLVGSGGSEPESISEVGESGPVTRKVRPGDIAILVPSNKLGEAVRTVLADASIPAVRLGTGSVFEADWLIDQVSILFDALDRPAYLPFVRSVALSIFFGRSPDEVDPLSERSAEIVERIQTQCHFWSRELAKKPFMEWWVEVRDNSNVVPRLMNFGDAERMVTDLDHLMEIISEWGGSRPVDAASILQFVEDQKNNLASESDSHQRRIESDSQAVKISTIHRSKGLEFPIVMVPFSWYPLKAGGGRSAAPPRTFDHPINHQPMVAVNEPSPWVAWLDTSVRPPVHDPKTAQLQAFKFAEEHTKRGEKFRTLYVALTRAKHQTIVWWSRTQDSKPVKKEPLTALLVDRDEFGRPKRTLQPPSKAKARGWNFDSIEISVPTTTTEILDILAPVVANSAGGDPTPNLSFEVIDPDAEFEVDEFGDESEVEQPELLTAPVGNRVVNDEIWRRWSFSGIKRDRELDTGESVVVDAFETNENGDEKKGVEDLDREVQTSSEKNRAQEGEPFGRHGGKLFGVFAHEVFEVFDSSKPDLESEVARALSVASESTSYAYEDDLIQAITAVAQTPLGPAFEGQTLSRIHPSDRLVEMRFDFPINGDLDERRLVSAIGDVLGRFVTEVPESAREIFAAYCESLQRSERRLAGYMHGAIDAIFRVHGSTGNRYVVTDYKTNRLHSSDDPNWREEYHPQNLWTSMVESDYLLQAIIYSVATHRFLLSRLGSSYDAKSHFGGISYLYLRGMIGASTERFGEESYGVFTWRPDARLIIELDAILGRQMPDKKSGS